MCIGEINNELETELSKWIWQQWILILVGWFDVFGPSENLAVSQFENIKNVSMIFHCFIFIYFVYKSFKYHCHNSKEEIKVSSTWESDYQITQNKLCHIHINIWTNEWLVDKHFITMILEMIFYLLFQQFLPLKIFHESAVEKYDFY